MRAYLALLRAGFQRQTSYRLALVAGLDVADALTYVWVLEGLALTVAALLLPLRLPGTLGGLALLGASLVLAAVVSFQLRFLFGSAAFWTPDYRSLFMLLFPVLWLASGFVVPVDFFPGPLRALVDWSSLIPLMMAPVRVAWTPRRAWLAAPVAGAFLALGGLAWRAGIRHYVGTGS